MYGYVDPGSLAQGTGTALLAPLFMWVYLMISLVLLVNLLIAIFNDTYATVQGEKSQIWKLRRVFVVQTHDYAMPLPPPFNVPLFLLYGLLLPPVIIYRVIFPLKPDNDASKQLRLATGTVKKSGKGSARVSPDAGPQASAAYAAKLAAGLLPTVRSMEVEEIERKARVRFIRKRPHFEDSLSKSVDERLQDAARYAPRTRPLKPLALSLTHTSITYTGTRRVRRRSSSRSWGCSRSRTSITSKAFKTA